jgi:hypothetical protein
MREHFSRERVEDVRHETLILRHPHLKLRIRDDLLDIVVLDDLHGFCWSRHLPIEDRHQVGTSAWAFRRMKFSRVSFSITGGPSGLRELAAEEDDAMDMN